MMVVAPLERMTQVIRKLAGTIVRAAGLPLSLVIRAPSVSGACALCLPICQVWTISATATEDEQRDLSEGYACFDLCCVCCCAHDLFLLAQLRDPGH